MSEITYRTPCVEDAEKIVSFYNYVGGETSYLSFEKDEYPLDVPAQKESILSLEGNPNNIMLLAMAGEEIAVSPPSVPPIKSKAAMTANWASSWQRSTRARESAPN